MAWGAGIWGADGVGKDGKGRVRFLRKLPKESRPPSLGYFDFSGGAYFTVMLTGSETTGLSWDRGCNYRERAAGYVYQGPG